MRAVSGLLVVLGLAGLVALFIYLKPVPTPPPAIAAPSAMAAPAANVVEPLAEPRFEFTVREGRLVSAPTLLRVQVGQAVNLSILDDSNDTLHLHGYDQSLKISAGQPVALRFIANHSGRFTLELHHSGIELGALEVMPAE